MDLTILAVIAVLGGLGALLGGSVFYFSEKQTAPKKSKIKADHSHEKESSSETVTPKNKDAQQPPPEQEKSPEHNSTSNQTYHFPKQIPNKVSTTLYVQIWENRIKVTDISTGNIFDEEPLIAIQRNSKGKKVIVAVGNSASLPAYKKEGIEIINPFFHIRSLLSSFETGERLLQYIFGTLLKGVITKRGVIIGAPPKVIMHPMEKIEGGLTDIERKAFRELAISAGAKDVVVYQGADLIEIGFNRENAKQSRLHKYSTV